MKIKISVIVIVILMVLSTGRSYCEEKKTNEILIINSYNKGLIWTDNIVESIESLLKGRANLYIEYMDTKRVSDEEYYVKLCDLYKYKYGDKKFDIVIVSDNNALDFIKCEQISIFDDTPILFCGINDYSPELIAGIDNITGVVEDIDIKKNVELAMKLNPYVKKVFFISDDKKTGQLNKKEAQETMESYFPDLEYRFSSGMTTKGIVDELKYISDDEIVILLAYTGQYYDEYLDFKEVARTFSDASRVPIYTAWDFYLDEGAFGGYLISSHEQGREVAKMALEIMGGKDVSNIEIKQNDITVPIFDYKVMKKFKIDRSELPKGSKLINRPTSIYEEYREVVIISLSFMAFLAFLNIILYDKIKRKSRDLQQSNNQLKDTLSSLEEAQNHIIESEKMAYLGNLVAGVSHEINTPIGNCLTVTTNFMYKSEKMKKLYETARLKKTDLIEYIELGNESGEMILKNLDRASELIKSFKQIGSDDSFNKSREFNVKDHIEDVLVVLKPDLEKTNISVELICDDEFEIYSRPGLFTQIMTNLISNTIRHGYDEFQEGKIRIEMEERDGMIYMKYRDYGKGISPENIEHIYEPFFTTKRNQGSSGLGLNIVYNTVVQKLKGRIYCESEEGVETRFTIEIPGKNKKETD